METTQLVNHRSQLYHLPVIKEVRYVPFTSIKQRQLRNAYLAVDERAIDEFLSSPELWAKGPPAATVGGGFDVCANCNGDGELCANLAEGRTAVREIVVWCLA